MASGHSKRPDSLKNDILTYTRREITPRIFSVENILAWAVCMTSWTQRLLKLNVKADRLMGIGLKELPSLR